MGMMNICVLTEEEVGMALWILIEILHGIIGKQKLYMLLFTLL